MMDGNRRPQIHIHLPKPSYPKVAEECSMCGDFGFTKDLFQCRTCLSRFQHTYCSRSFPNIASEMWICNWCLHRNDHHKAKRKEKWGGLEAEQGNDSDAETKPKCVFKVALQVPQVVAEAEAKVGGGETVLVPRRSNSSSSGEISKSSDQNDSRLDNVNAIKDGCPKRKRYYPELYTEKKKDETPVEKSAPQIRHQKMVPRLPCGKRRRYRLLSHFSS